MDCINWLQLSHLPYIAVIAANAGRETIKKEAIFTQSVKALKLTPLASSVFRINQNKVHVFQLIAHEYHAQQFHPLSITKI